MASPSTYALQLSVAEIDRYVEMARLARAREVELWRNAGIVAGAHVADIGCGPGAVLAELAAIVGPSGTATGVEPNTTTRRTARTILDAHGLRHVDVTAGTGTATGLTPGRWDCVMLRHVLAHVGDQAGPIVAHLATLLAPGGRLYVVDTDTESFLLSPNDAAMTEQLQQYTEFHRHLGNNTRVGSLLPSIIGDAGLEVVQSRATNDWFDATIVRDGWPLRAVQDAMIAAGHLHPDDLQRLAAARLRFAERPRSAVGIRMHIVIARHPVPAAPAETIRT